MKFSWVKLLLPTFRNTVVCAIIAQVVLEMALAPSYAQSITVSLSIGYSIQLTFFVFDRFLYPGSTSYWVGLIKSAATKQTTTHVCSTGLANTLV